MLQGQIDATARNFDNHYYTQVRLAVPVYHMCLEAMPWASLHAAAGDMHQSTGNAGTHAQAW